MSTIASLPSVSTSQATMAAATIALFNQSAAASGGGTALPSQLKLLESGNKAAISEAAILDSSNASLTSLDMNSIASTYDSLNSPAYKLSPSLQNVINNNTPVFNAENGITQLASGVYGTNPSTLLNLPTLQSDSSSTSTLSSAASQAPLDMSSIITNYNSIENQITNPNIGSNVNISA